VPPAALVAELAAVVAALAAAQNQAVAAECAALVGQACITDAAKAVASVLTGGEKRAVFLGNLALQHPNAASIRVLAAEIARLSGAVLGVLGESAGCLGGHLVGALPKTGLNARQMLESPRKAYILLGLEPELDCADPVLAREALTKAGSVIHIGSFAGKAAEYADVMLPAAPFTETSGTYVNAEGRVQSFNAVVQAKGEVRPAWKVLRVLGNLLGLEGFEYESSEAVRDAALPRDIATHLNNGLSGVQAQAGQGTDGLQRIADVPSYFADPLVRRAASLQKTRDAKAPEFVAAPQTLTALGIEDGAQVRVSSAVGSVALRARADAAIPAGSAKVSAAHASTAGLGGMFCELKVERA